MPRLLALPAALAVAVLSTLGACGDVRGDFSPPSVVTFQIACAGEGDEALNLWRGVQLWDELGVDVRIDVQEVPDAVVCFVDDLGEHAGYTGFRDDNGTVSIQIRSGMETNVIGPVFAHELGHAILPGSHEDNHLPDGELGIMSPHITGGWWSPADLEFLASFGLPLQRAAY